jgi:hypothetical protein
MGAEIMSRFPFTEAMFALPRYQPPSAWTGHVPFAAWIIEKAEPRVFVELGTHAGASYMGFCQAVHDLALATQCYAIDTWAGDEHAGHYGEEVYTTLKQHHDPAYGGFSRLMRMSFDDALSCFSDESVDLLHIDGLHTYEAVRHDFESWLPKLSSRGIVLFHDISERERGFGVWRLWEEVRSSYPSFSFPHAHGLGVLLVGRDVPSEIFEVANAADSEVLMRRMFASLGRLVISEQHRAHFERLVVIREQELTEAHADLSNLRDEIAVYRAHECALISEREALASRLEASESEVVSLNVALDAVAAIRDGIARERDVLSSELTSLRAAYDETDAIRRALDDRHDKAIAALESAREEVERSGQETSLVKDELANAVAALRERDETIDAMKSSRSWRLTAPLRWFARVLG